MNFKSIQVSDYCVQKLDMGLTLHDMTTCPPLTVYSLKAVLYHGGNHYIAALADTDACSWHEYDDSRVKKHKDWDALARRFQRAGMHPNYLLFAKDA